MKCKTCEFDPCRCDDLAAGYMGQSCTTTCWPQVSKALAVHPKQRAQVIARNKRHGINVSYDALGRPTLPDRATRKALCRLEGVHDNEGSYGDA